MKKTPPPIPDTVHPIIMPEGNKKVPPPMPRAIMSDYHGSKSRDKTTPNVYGIAEKGPIKQFFCMHAAYAYFMEPADLFNHMDCNRRLKICTDCGKVLLVTILEKRLSEVLK